MYSLVPSPSQLFNVSCRKEGRVCIDLEENVTCMTFQVNVWSMYNYHAWALVVLTTATDSIINLKGALIVTTLADTRLVTLTNAVACYHEAFGHYSLRSIHCSNDQSGSDNCSLTCQSIIARTSYAFHN